MNEKKWLSIFFAALLVLLVIGCSTPEPTPVPVVEEPEAEQETVDEPTATPEPVEQEDVSAEANVEDVEQIRVAIVMPSTITDLAWSQALYDSLVRLQTQAGGPENFEIAFSESMFNVTDAATAIRDYASDGYNVVFAHGTQYGTSLFEIAPDFPETTFAYGTAVETGVNDGIENIFAYEARAEEGGYAAGVLAGNLTESGVIGVVGPVEAGDAKLYIDGFVAGAKAANPDAQVNVSYTGSFGDTALAAEAANTHIAAGADILTGSAQQVVGAIGVAEEAGVPWIGTQSDQSPQAPDTVIATQLYVWDGILSDIINKHLAGEYGGTAYALTLANGGLIMDYKDSVDGGAVAAAQAAASDIANGALDPMGAMMEEGDAMEEDAAMMDYPEIEPVRIALVMPSTTTDLSWSQSIYDGLAAIQAHYGEDMVEIAVSESMFNVTDAAAALRDYAEEGYNLVIAHGAQYGTSLFEIAPDYPETSFAWGTTTNTGEEEGVTNIFAYEPRADEGGYVSGVLAANLTEVGIIGLVGPVDAGDAKLHVDGFLAGVRDTNPEVQVNVSFTGSFGDTALAAEAANTQIAAGADVLTGSSQQVVGAIGVAQEAGIPWLGIQADQSPAGEDVVVATAYYDWTNTLLEMITSNQAGDYGGRVLQLTLANGGQRMEYDESLPAEAVEAAKAAEQGIIEGSIEIVADPRN